MVIRRGYRGQAAMEMVLALIGAGIIFVGILATWSWLIAAVVDRTRTFDASRRKAGTPDPAHAGSLLKLPPKKLKVFNE